MPYDYDVMVIGGGAAGLTASGMAAQLGARTMMIEAERLGGDCTWYGCIPSKALLKISQQVQQTQRTLQWLGHSPLEGVPFAKVMQRVSDLQHVVYEEADRPEIYQAMGVDTVFGQARFLDPHRIVVEASGSDRVFSSKYIVIATGSDPAIPEIPGLKTLPYLTNKTIFSISHLPESLAVIGAGPMGCELGQAFRRLGSRVVLFEQNHRVLSMYSDTITRHLSDQFIEEGIQLQLNTRLVKLESKDKAIVVTYENSEGIGQTTVSHVLVASGRTPRISSLELDRAGVRYDDRGIRVNAHARTNQKHIFAIGDVTGYPALTHVAEHMAKTAISNMLLKLPLRLEATEPSAVFTEPEVAKIGLNPEQLTAKGKAFKTYRFPYTKVDRGLAEDRPKGEIQVYARAWDGKIYGAQVVGANAGELIGELGLAIRHGISMRKLSDTLHAYPTYAPGVRRAADQWYIQSQKPWQVRWLKRLFGYRGAEPDLSNPDRIV